MLPETLRVGLKLQLDLQEVRVEGAEPDQRVHVKDIGKAEAEVLKLLGSGGNAQVYACSLSGSLMQRQAAGRPPGAHPRPQPRWCSRCHTYPQA